MYSETMMSYRINGVVLEAAAWRRAGVIFAA